MTIKKFVRPEVLNLPTINVPASESGAIRLNANEAPESLWKDEDKHSLNRYPSPRPQNLINELAAFYDISNDQISISRGSTEAIDIIMRTFCIPYKDEILISPPTFDMYKFFANANSIKTNEMPLCESEDFCIDINKLIKNFNDKTKIIFISSPNNPTGTIVSNTDIEYLLKKVKNKAIVVLDEAYIEFSEFKTMTAKINTYENLIILRTLSKAYALAGVRCGAIIANSEISEFIKKILPPFCFATPTIELIKNSIIPENINNAKTQINLIKKEKERVSKELNKTTIVNKVFQSEGNFLLVKFNDINKLKSTLENTNIIIGFLKYPSLSKFARITIGTRDENDALLNLLIKIQ